MAVEIDRNVSSVCAVNIGDHEAVDAIHLTAGGSIADNLRRVRRRKRRCGGVAVNSCYGGDVRVWQGNNPSIVGKRSCRGEDHAPLRQEEQLFPDRHNIRSFFGLY